MQSKKFSLDLENLLRAGKILVAVAAILGLAYFAKKSLGYE